AWPLMRGTLFPTLGGHATMMFVHRFAAVLTGAIVAAFIWRANRARPREAAVRIFANIAGVLYLAQVIVGGLQVLSKLSTPSVVAHVVLSSLLWASLVAAYAVARGLHRPVAVAETHVEEPDIRRAGFATTFRAYLALTKPRIIVLLVVTTVPTMLLAARGWPSGWLILATVLGGTLAAGAANT